MAKPPPLGAARHSQPSTHVYLNHFCQQHPTRPQTTPPTLPSKHQCLPPLPSSTATAAPPLPAPPPSFATAPPRPTKPPPLPSSLNPAQSQLRSTSTTAAGRYSTQVSTQQALSRPARRVLLRLLRFVVIPLLSSLGRANLTSLPPTTCANQQIQLLSAPPAYSACIPEKDSLVANNYDLIIDAYFYYRTLEDAMRGEGLGRGQGFEEVKSECDRLHKSIICWRVGRLRT